MPVGEAIEELRIRYVAVGEGRYLVLANGPSQAVDVIEWHSPVEFAAELEHLVAEAISPPLVAADTPLPSRTADLGRALFAALVPPRILGCLKESLDLVRDADRELRIRFHLPDELAHLPVELVYDDDLGGALALNGELSIARTVRGAPTAAGRLPRVDRPATQLTIMIVAASPPGRSDLPELALAHEVEQITHELEGCIARQWVKLRVLGEATGGEPATYNAIEALARQQKDPLVVVVLGHGTRDEHDQMCVVLDAEDGAPDPVSAEALAGVLSNAPQLRCVVLNLCTGARVTEGRRLSGVAQAIAGKGIPAVVGMSTTVTDLAAARFSGPLLAALSENETVDEAMQRARGQMRNPVANTAIEWVAPVLCLAEGPSVGQLFTVRDLRSEHHPLKEGAAAAEQIHEGRGGWEILLPAALYGRAVGEWRQVQATTEQRLRQEAPATDQPRLERLWTEASVELAVPGIIAICDDLAADRDPESPRWNGVPPSVTTAIRDEVTAAGRRRAGISAMGRKDWAVAVDQLTGFTRRAYRDGRALLAYAQGRLAQTDGRWTAARAAYLQVGDSLPELDAPRRACFVEGRAAEDDGQWRRAAQAYCGVGAPGARDDIGASDAFEDMGDVAQRLHYAEGRACEGEDWSGAASAYQRVDDHHRADVAVRRAYAEARVAEAAADFDAVASVLQGHDPAAGDGDLGPLRGYAQARLAEAIATARGTEPQEWEKTASFYAGLRPADRDVGTRLCYARGRSAEARGAWPEAREAYASVVDPDGLFPDTATRLAAVTGRAAEAARDWAAVVAAWEAIPDAPYAAGRLAFARACVAVGHEDWNGVADVLPDPAAVALDLRPAALSLVRYAVARRAERDRDWPAAAAAHREAAAGVGTLAPIQDAPHRAAFADGRCLEDAGDWTGAVAAYDDARGRVPEADSAAARLTVLRATVPWLDGLGRRTRVEDPASVDESPYQALAAAGITPGSAQREVTDASFALVRNRSWTHGVRIAWDGLRRVAGRLEADMVLLPVLDGAGLARAQRELDPDASLEDNLARLARGAEADAALCDLMAGRRDAAIGRWHRRLEADLDSSPDAHALAVAWTWGASEAGADGRHEDALDAWEHAIAFWGRALADEAYWETWRTEREATYAYPVPPAQVLSARRALVERLSSRLGAVAERARADGRDDEARRCDRLRLALAVEIAAAGELAAAGGWADDDPTSVPCGPLFVERFPRIRRAVGRLAARMADAPAPSDLPDEPGDGPGDDPTAGPRSTALRVRCLFSRLGPSLVLLDHRRPERALEELDGLHTVAFAELAAGFCREAHDPDDCAACQELAVHDPAHVGLPHPRVRLLLDAVDIAVRSQFALAWSALADPRHGTAGAVRHWREAIAVAGNAGTTVRTKREVVRAVVNRCGVARGYWGSEQTDARLTEAIGLVDAAAALLDGAGAGELTTTQAALLASRGLWRGCWRYRFEEPSYELGTADLRRAVALDPASVHARDNLAYGLIFYASSLEETGNAERRFDQLGEALAVVHEGMLRSPDYVAFPAALEAVVEALDMCCLDRLTREDLRAIRASGGDRPSVPDQVSEAEREIGAGRPVNGVRLLISAARREPPGSDAWSRLLTAVDDLSGRGGVQP